MECHYCFDRAECVLTEKYELVCAQCWSEFKLQPAILGLNTPNDQIRSQVETILNQLNTDLTVVANFFSSVTTHTNLMPLPLSVYHEAQLKTLTLARDLFTTITGLLDTHPNLPLPAYTRFEQPLRRIIVDGKQYVSDNTLFKVLSQQLHITPYEVLYSNPAIAMVDLLSLNVNTGLDSNCILNMCEREDFTAEIFAQYRDKLRDSIGGLIVPFQVKILPMLEMGKILSQVVLNHHPDINMATIKRLT